MNALSLLAGACGLPARPEPPMLVPQDDPYRRSHRYKRTRGCPACPACRVTLSHGDCLQRNCKLFIGTQQQLKGPSADLPPIYSLDV